MTMSRPIPRYVISSSLVHIVHSFYIHRRAILYPAIAMMQHYSVYYLQMFQVASTSIRIHCRSISATERQQKQNNPILQQTSNIVFLFQT